MLILALISSVYSIFIIYTFNLLPYKWFCDYGTEYKKLSQQNYIPQHIYFLPVFLFTFICIKFFLNSFCDFFQLFIYIILILLFVHICLSDIFYMIIPDQHILLIFSLGLLDIPYSNISSKIIGFFTGVLPFLILLIIGLLLKNEEYIGFGDIKLMASLGFLVGYTNIINIYIISSLLSGIFFILLLIFIKITKKNTSLEFLPFAPFIIFSCIFCITR